MNTVTPTSLGFHCNGECWHDAGGAEGLIEALGEGPKRDWFVRADWASESNIGTHALPSLDQLHTLQDYIVMEAVDRYREGLSPQNQAAHERYPVLFIWRGKYWTFQGTHRIAALHLNGQESYRGWLVNLDV